jgi:hypothetical protein
VRYWTNLVMFALAAALVPGPEVESQAGQATLGECVADVLEAPVGSATAVLGVRRGGDDAGVTLAIECPAHVTGSGNDDAFGHGRTRVLSLEEF